MKKKRASKKKSVREAVRKYKGRGPSRKNKDSKVAKLTKLAKARSRKSNKKGKR